MEELQRQLFEREKTTVSRVSLDVALSEEPLAYSIACSYESGEQV